MKLMFTIIIIRLEKLARCALKIRVANVTKQNARTAWSRCVPRNVAISWLLGSVRRVGHWETSKHMLSFEHKIKIALLQEFPNCTHGGEAQQLPFPPFNKDCVECKQRVRVCIFTSAVKTKKEKKNMTVTRSITRQLLLTAFLAVSAQATTILR